MKNGWYKEGDVFKLYFNDQLIETSNTDPKSQTSSQTPEQKEGVPPMSYKPGTEPKTGETYSQWLLRTTGNPGIKTDKSIWDGTKWVDPAGTTTPATTTGEMSAEEKAVRDFATAKGQNPDEVWQNYQTITSSYGTMGAGTQQPYGYGVSGMVPYRYKHRGYGAIGWDRGYVPGVGDLAAMQEQANRMGYDFTGKSRPTLFGGRKVVIKTHYNPSTGKVENKPTVESTEQGPAPTWGVPQQTPSPLLTPQDRYNLDKEQAIREGQAQMTPAPIQSTIQPVETNESSPYMPIEDNRGFPIGPPSSMRGTLGEDNKGYPTVTYNHGGALNRFLPKHQVLGETGFKFDNLDINVPIMDTFHNIKTGLTSINDFKQQRADARREKRGTNEKAVWKTGPSPYAADATLTGMAAITNLARGKERRALEEKLATGKMSDKLFTSVGKNQGDYVPTGQQYGMFRPDQTTPIFDSGYDRGYAGRSSYGFDKGGSIGYSDWSQTPVNGYYGVPQGEFNPYSKWSQAPVMQSGGPTLTPEQQQAQYNTFTQTPEWSDYQRAKKDYEMSFKAYWNPNLLRTSDPTALNANEEKFKQASAKVPLWMQNYNPNLQPLPANNAISNRQAFQTGGAMIQDGVYDLTEDEINEIIQMGGQVEFLD